jgi:hypothetical protein
MELDLHYANMLEKLFPSATSHMLLIAGSVCKTHRMTGLPQRCLLERFATPSHPKEE